MRNPNHLGAQRKRWKLSNQELAHLIGYCFKSTISRAERDNRPPTLKFALGCEVIFGKSASELFPSLYAEIEDAVMRRAAKLDERLRTDFSHEAEVKRYLISDMARRAGNRRDA